MKKIILLLSALAISLSANAQGPFKKILERFDDPDRGHTVFIEKGSRSIGIAGSYRSIRAGGTENADGFSILSLLNMGTGQAHIWRVAPKFNWFVANDFALGIRLEYSGYWVDSNLRLDLRDMLGGLVDDPSSEEGKAALDALNVTVSNRHWHQHSGGLSFTARKYLSFFGSKTFGVFGEGLLFARYGATTSYPRSVEFVEDEMAKHRFNQSIGVGLKGVVGLAVKLRDGSLITGGIPIFGIEYGHTIQNKQATASQNKATMSSFRIARDLDLIGIQIAYSRIIGPKKRK